MLGLSHGTSPMYGLKLPARALCAVTSSSSHLFLVGTCSLKEENEIQLIEYNESDNEIKQLAIMAHTQEIGHIAASHHQPDICATAYPIGASPYMSDMDGE